MSARPVMPPAGNPAACASWLPLEELTRLSAVAHAMARSECEPPGASFFECGEPWSNRQTFVESLLDDLALLLGEYAMSVGAGDMPCHDPERLALLRRKDA